MGRFRIRELIGNQNTKRIDERLGTYQEGKTARTYMRM